MLHSTFLSPPLARIALQHHNDNLYTLHRNLITPTMSQQQNDNMGNMRPSHSQQNPEADSPEQARLRSFLAGLTPCPNAGSVPRTLPKTPDCRRGPRTPEERAMFEAAMAAQASSGPSGPAAGRAPPSSEQQPEEHKEPEDARRSASQD